ncbi:MAG: ABC transporter permease [Actinobacteria bacterium]|nr:ABC transporter permease [Actinomycetota bacterium]
MRLARYTLRRLALLVPVLVGVSLVTFVLIRVLPGDPVRTLMPATATEADIEAARQRFGLDDSIVTQYGIWLKGVVQGDLGTSFQTGVKVTTELGQRIGPTLELVTVAVLLALLLAVPLGVLAARRARRLPDHAVRLAALSGGAVFELWLGLLLIYVFYYHLDLAPAPSGRIGTGIDLESVTTMEVVDSILTWNGAALSSSLAHLALPAITLAIVASAALTRGVRASALEVLSSEAYACAEAHGLRRGTLLLRYTVRGALVGLPALTALIYGYLLGGAVLVEFVFSWQGFGQWALNGLRFRDYPVIQTFVLVSAAFYVLVFLVADVVHALLDPRVRL